MLHQPTSRILVAMNRLGLGADSETSDATLLERFIHHRDEQAFEMLMRRHGDLVWRACRRHLENQADAEDAFQAVFLVLARDASRIGRREAVAGWLYRVAYHVARKLMGKNAKRRMAPLPEVAAPDSSSVIEEADQAMAIDSEIHALPDRLRSAVVLCYLEGRSNTEAAAILGCPRGTVDSRLASARRRLQERLLQRGVALAAPTVLATTWAADVGAAPPLLLSRTSEAVSVWLRTGSAAGAVTAQVLSLVSEVSPFMSTQKLAMVLMLALGLTLAGGAGLTIYSAGADETKPRPTGAPSGKTTEKKLETGKPANPPVAANTAASVLQAPCGFNSPIDSMTFKELLEYITDKHGISARIDLASFSRIGMADAVQLYERPIKVPVVKGLTLADLLRDALAQLSPDGSTAQASFRIRENQIVIVPAYVTQFSSVGGGHAGAGGEEPLSITPGALLEQTEGDPITLAVEDKPFTEILQTLRRATGANIVLDNRHKDKAKQLVTADLHDVRLLAALKVLSDMCDLQPVPLNNIYYITSKENAERLQRELDRKRYGEPQMGTLGNPGGIGIAPNLVPEPVKPTEKK